MFKNVATKIAVFAFDTTTSAPKTGDAAQISVYVSKDYGAVTQLTDTSATEMDATNAKGWYLFDVTQTEANADALLFTGKSSTGNVSVVGQYIHTTPNRFTTMVIDAAGLVDATAVKVGPTGAATAQTAKDVGGAVPAAAAGASGGLLISGSNAGTTTLAALTVTGITTHTGNVLMSAGLTVNQSTANGSAIDVTGNGTGHGIRATSGSGITGNGLQVTCNSTNGHGLSMTGKGTGNALLATPGLTGNGFSILGGGTSGNGINVVTTSGHAVNLAPVGTSMHGILSTGGNGGTSDGIKAVAGTGGVPIRGDITGNITGNLSGSAGSVTGAVGSVTGSVASVTGSVASVTGSVGSVTGSVGSVTGAVGSVTGLTASDVGAIKLQTDKMVFTVANMLDANIQYVNDTQIQGTGAVGTDEWRKV